jgi:hypothetical protein
MGRNFFRETQMFSTSNLLSRGLLLAGAVALPLFGGAVLAQTAPQAAPAATTTVAPAAAASTTSASTDKPIGAMKATPAEKKAEHDKKATAQTTSGTKASTAVKKPAVDSKSAPAAQSTKPAGTPVTQ